MLRKNNFRVIFIQKLSTVKMLVVYYNIETKINKRGIFFTAIKLLFKQNLKLKLCGLLVKAFSFLLSFLLIKKINADKAYPYLLFFRKNLDLNRWFLNINNFLMWLIFNCELLFSFKKPINAAYGGEKGRLSIFFILKQKRKKFFFKWIKNQLGFIVKKNLFFKMLSLFLDLVLNYKKSIFFKFKSSIYKSLV